MDLAELDQSTHPSMPPTTLPSLSLAASSPGPAAQSASSEFGGLDQEYTTPHPAPFEPQESAVPLLLPLSLPVLLLLSPLQSPPCLLGVLASNSLQGHPVLADL